MIDLTDEFDAENSQVMWFSLDGSTRVEDEEDDEIPSNNEWIQVDDEYYPAKDTKVVKKVPAGFYGVLGNQGKYSIFRRYINNDELIRLPDAKIDFIVDEINKFWDSAPKFKEANVIHKRGILFHGKPGCGKTSVIAMLSEAVVERGGIIFHITSIAELNLIVKFTHDYLRDIQPDTPIVYVIEDIDNLVNQNESALLRFLSGEDQVEHCVIVATTNRINELNDLLLRPSRFDWVEELKAPSPEARTLFLQTKKVNDADIEKWVKATEGFTMAQLKEVYIAVSLLDNDFDSVIKKLKDQEKGIKISTYKPTGNSVGFR